jgi:uncharacterized RDD family membrane protein YckC
MLHEVLTTEKVPFVYRVAGLGSRSLAWMIDFSLVVLIYLAGIMVGIVWDIGMAGLGDAIIFLWIFAVNFGYFLLFEWLWQGSTPGKKALGIRVIQLRGTSVNFLSATIRNVVRMVDLMFPFYTLGVAVAACDAKQRRLGDFAAGTLVVHVQRKAQPIRVMEAAKSEASRVDEQAARQRLMALTREQKQTLLDLALRREQLRIEDRAKLFRALAEYFRGELGLAADVHESDERFVVRLAALLSERSPLEADLQAPRGRPGRGTLQRAGARGAAP